MTLLLECLPDEVLARHLGKSRKECLHLNDKGRVCVRLQKSEKLVAMIDEDPGAAQPHYLGKLHVRSESNNLRVLDDLQRRHLILILRPRLEEWIIGAAYDSKISMEDFGLSRKGNTLHREIISRISNFKKLLVALSELQNSRLQILARLLTEFEMK